MANIHYQNNNNGNNSIVTKKNNGEFLNVHNQSKDPNRNMYILI